MGIGKCLQKLIAQDAMQHNLDSLGFWVRPVGSVIRFCILQIYREYIVSQKNDCRAN